MSEKKTINKGEAIRFGWETVKKNFLFFLGLFLIILAINFIPQMLFRGQENNTGFLVVLIGILTALVRLITDMGMLKINLSLVEGKKGEYNDLIHFAKEKRWKTILNYFLGSFLYNLMVIAGLILLIIPGIYLALRFQYFNYLIIEKNLGPIEAFRESSKMTEGVKWQLFLFGLLLGLINILGALALVVGLLLTVPTTMIAGAYMYRHLLKHQS